MPFSFAQYRQAWLLRLSKNDWRFLLLGCVVLSLALIALAWWVSWQRLDAEKAILSRNAQIQQENLAAIISENLAQVLDRGQLMSIAANEWFEGKPGDATNRLSAMRAADRAFLRIALYNRDLHRVYTSSPSVDPPSLRQALQLASREPPGAWSEGLRVAPLPTSDEQAWQVPLLFPVFGNDNQTHGLLLVILDLGYFLDFYQRIDIGRSGIIQIFKTDGEEIAEVRQAGLVFKRRDSPPHLATDGARQGSISAPLPGENNIYLSSFRQLEHHPFVVAVSRDIEETLAAHNSSRSRFLGMLIVLTGIISLATFFVARSIRHQGLLYSELSRADGENRLLIDQLEEEKRRAFKLAAHDHLTNLPNRRMFHELVVSHLSKAKRSRKHYALLYLDLDRFKYINDTLGHHVGDLLLQAVSNRLCSSLRASDVVARLGGDEFAVLLTGLEQIKDAANVAAKIVEQLSHQFDDLDGNDILVSASVGIAIFPRDGHDFDTLCRHADAAMYESKRGGRGRYTFYDPDLNPAGDKLFNLEQRLPRAIANNELVLHFQPKVRLSDYRIVGFEALVRWQHQEFGLIYPNDFIPLAEHAGFIISLGDWVAEACCRELAAWQAAGLDLVPIACNVSAKQLLDTGLPDRFAGFLATHGVAAQHLEIEITESSLLESIDIAGSVLRRLEKLGIGIALDDFGKGFSNLTHIRSLPIHCLKIDRAFVAGIRNNPDDAVIVHSIITLAHNLRMRVIAEGIELLEQLVHLKTAGCDEVQGYFLSRPVAGENARQLLIRSTLAPA